ncbi:protein phosphatase 2C domain-containing protein [Niveibacterium sp. SC-1]|uniref:PP2C family protein-serine/threonine phosphatase n=1 Tax=Niveibacterium sp. SC-1 TaxID=3135646 RepID=UPI00311F6AE4
MPLTVDSVVAMHQGDRKEQQDRVGLFPHPTRPGMLLAVLADGMGGHSGGAMAAEQVVIKAKQNFEAYSPGSESPEELLRAIIEEAHVVIKLTRFTSEQDPHSTVCVLLMQPGKVHWAHCGDSRIYHFRDGQVANRSNDHSLVAELVRTGQLSEADAETYPHKNLLLSCLGAEREPRIEIGSCTGMRAGDAFLLCSDGLWGHFADDEIAEAISMNVARQAARELIDQARGRAQGTGDNISMAIVRLVEAGAQ